jgi:adenine-specific DNA-methyltransferase
MRRFEADDPVTRSADNVADNVEVMRELFPEAFTEGRVDFEVLRQLLGDDVEEREERYGLTWHGKRRARQLALTPSTGTLLPRPDQSVDWDTTRNLFIEGDNLEVLKLLQKSYAGRIKLIYIDPPYNTGKDFVYKDDFRDNIRNYLEVTGQTEGGRKLTTNTESSGRFHTDWLNMMYPRLKLARDLLTDDGVLFISIDDGEVANLRLACDEIFGEENFFAQIPWQSRTSMQNDTDLGVQHEFLVAYARMRRVEHRRLKDTNVDVWYSLDSFAAYPLPLDETRYDNPDDDPRGKWKADPFDAPNIRPNLTYEIVNPRTNVAYLPPAGRCWRTERASYERLLADNRIVFGRTGDSRPQLKVFYEERRRFGETPSSWFDGATYGTVTSGTRELQQLFGGSSPFSFPKPTSLLRAIVRMCTSGDDTVLDFFAGSGTTGHAVWAQNADDGGRRRHVLVQLPEPIGAGSAEEGAATRLLNDIGRPANIAELAKERIQRAATRIATEHPEMKERGDLGFRVFSLAESNIRPWSGETGDLPGALLDAVEHVRSDRSEEDLLFELVLKLGLDLCVPVERRVIAGAEVRSVGGGTLMACLAESLPATTADAVAQGLIAWHGELAPAGDTVCVFRDSAFPDDVVKTNVAAILAQHGITDVRSL